MLSSVSFWEQSSCLCVLRFHTVWYSSWWKFSFLTKVEWLFTLFFFFPLQLLQTSSPYRMPTSFGTYSTQTISGKFIFMRSRANSAFQSLQCLVLCSISWSSYRLSFLAIIALSSYMRSKRSWEKFRVTVWAKRSRIQKGERKF